MRRSILASLLVLSGCSAAIPPQTFIDGYPVGESVEADRRYVDVATAALDEASPGHAQVSMAEMYVPDHRMRDGNYYLIASGAGATVLVVVLRLASGEVQASLVWCGVVGYPDRCGLGDPPSNL